MCLILFSYDQHPKYQLILAANRDEFLERPTAPAASWDEHPGLIAGRDLKAGGTWMGITADLRFAAITNYRDPASEKKDAPSRGHLVSDYLKGKMHPEAYLQALDKRAAEYNGYNLLLGSGSDLWYYSNKENLVKKVRPGIHGLSNHLMNTPWPKVERGKLGLQNATAGEHISSDALIALLKDPQTAPDEALPSTGVPLEWERMLSPMFIQAPHYGTRASTVMLIDRAGRVTFVEQTIGQGNNPDKQVTHSFVSHS
ncbi:MAG: NRDE family protein [Rhodothermales bacterium]